MKEKLLANRFRHESQFKNIFHSKIHMKKWRKPFNNFLIIKKDIIKF